METSIKILILEHDPNDIELLQYQLKKSGLNHISIVVQTRDEYQAALTQFQPDIILSDYSLPSFDGLSAFRIKQTIAPDVPFIIVSGTIGEENAVELIKMGVTDYALKEKLYQIPTKVQRALNEAADKRLKNIAERQLKEREEQLQKIMDLSLDVICTVDEEGRFVTVGAASIHVWGYAPDELIGKRVIELVHPEDKDCTYKAITALRNGMDMVNFENRYVCKDGNTVPMFWSARWDEAERLGYSVARNATDIKKAEEELQTQHNLVNNILEGISDGFFAVDYNWNVTYWNKEAERLLNTPKEKILNTNLWDTFVDAADTKSYLEYRRAVAEQVSITFEDYYAPFDTWFDITASPSKDRLVVYFRDITAKKREQRLATLEKEMLELYIASNATLPTAITYLLKNLLGLFPDIGYAVLSYRDGKLFNLGASSLPSNVLEQIDLNKTTCATAAVLNQKILVADILEESIWEENYELVLKHGLKACASYPICDARQNVIGVLAIFLKEARNITEPEEQIAETIVDILEPLIENDLAALAIQESEEKYRNLFDLSPLPMWVYDIDTLKFLDVNEAAVNHYGYSRDEFFAMTLKDIRPQADVEKFMSLIQSEASTGFYKKSVHKHTKKNGEIISVEVSGNFINLNGKKARVILASDISERVKYINAIEEQNTNLREIAWVQSHVVRAPLARLMGLISLLTDYNTGKLSTDEVLDLIMKSANELDDIIKTIVKKTEEVKIQAPEDTVE